MLLDSKYILNKHWLTLKKRDASKTWYYSGPLNSNRNWFIRENWKNANGQMPTSFNKMGPNDNFVFGKNVTAPFAIRYNSPSRDFAIGSITFESESNEVTVRGDKIAQVAKITNNNATYDMMFENKVQFASIIDINAKPKNVKMLGEAIGTTLGTGFTDLHGIFTLTSNWTVGASYTVKSNSTLTTKNVTNNASNRNLINVETNGKFIVDGNISCYSNASGSSPRIVHKTNGVVIVNGTATSKGNSGNPGKNTCLIGDSSSTGIFLANKFSFQYGVRGTNYHYYNIAKVGVGTGGIAYNNSAQNYPREFYCLGNWSFGDLSQGGNGRAYNQSSIAFHTSNYLNPTVGNTITATGCFNAHGGAGTDKPMTIDGCGSMVFNYAFGFGNLTVSDSAIVAVNAGKRPCAGSVTMLDASTFRLPQAGSGTVTLNGKLVLNAGTSIAYDNLNSSIIPLKTPELVVNDAQNVTVRIDGESNLNNGTYKLIEVTNGVIPDTYSLIKILGSAIPIDKTVSITKSEDSKTLQLEIH